MGICKKKPGKRIIIYYGNKFTRKMLCCTAHHSQYIALLKKTAHIIVQYCKEKYVQDLLLQIILYIFAESALIFYVLLIKALTVTISR